MWLSILLAGFGLPDAAMPYREIVVVESCAAWADGRETEATSAVHRVDDHGLCFFGSTTDQNSAAFVEAVAGIDPEKPLVVVVRSGGGEINAAMAMGEALVPRETTVMVHDLCASSCANYLFLAGDRRVILPGALLLYHGGIFEQSEEHWVALREEWSQRMNPRDLEASLKSSRDYETNSLARQAAFLENVDVDPDLFDWMQGLNALTQEEWLAKCPVPDASMMVFSDAILAERGIAVHRSDGPRSDAELAAELGKSAGMACYWD